LEKKRGSKIEIMSHDSLLRKFESEVVPLDSSLVCVGTM